MNKDKKETLIDLYYCFRYKCKRCPKQRECELEQKRGDTIERRKPNTICKGRTKTERIR